MRGLPNMSVFVPADCNECAQIIKYASEHKGPMYIRVPRSNVCDVYEESYKFDFNKAQVLQDGTDVTIFTNGETVAEAIEAVNELTKDGYSIGIVSVPVVKPIDAETIINQAKKSKFVITIENHSVIGGLGSAVCEVLSESHPTIVHRIGVNDKFGQTGKAEELLDCYGLSANKLKETIKHYIDKCCEK